MISRLAWVTLLVGSVLSGCGKDKKIDECNGFIDKVNTSLKQIEAQTNRKVQDDKTAATEMRQLADQYDKLASQVGGLEITTAELRTQALEYQKMANAAASAARQVATAIETKDAEKAKGAQQEFDKIVKHEDALVSRINAFCQQSE